MKPLPSYGGWSWARTLICILAVILFSTLGIVAILDSELGVPSRIAAAPSIAP